MLKQKLFKNIFLKTIKFSHLILDIYKLVENICTQQDHCFALETRSAY